MENTYTLIGWQQDGQPIETPAGIRVEDYFSDDRYLGADADGVEPILIADRGEAALICLALADGQALLDAGMTVAEAEAVAKYSGGVN